MKLFYNIACRYFLRPLKNGILGFVAFLFVLISTKYLSFLIGNQSKFIIDEEDFLLSLIGFVLFFLIRLLENTNEHQNQLR
jgi:hypothetical protein